MPTVLIDFNVLGLKQKDGTYQLNESLVNSLKNNGYDKLLVFVADHSILERGMDRRLSTFASFCHQLKNEENIRLAAIPHSMVLGAPSGKAHDAVKQGLKMMCQHLSGHVFN